MPVLVVYGLILTLVAGVLSGNFMLPMKFVRRWPWENVWLVFSVISLVIVPGVLALVMILAIIEALLANRYKPVNNTPDQQYSNTEPTAARSAA